MDDDRFELSEDTIRCGRVHIAEIRRRSGFSDVHETDSQTPSGNSQHDLISSIDDPSAMAAETAAGAEREHLQHRVLALKQENHRLRTALAIVQQAAAAGFLPHTSEDQRD